MRDGILANSGRGYGTPVLADLDGDGKAEILCASRGGTLQAFTDEGKPFRDGLFQSVARAEEGAEIVVVDLGDDGAMDLFIGARWLRFTPTGIEAWNLLPGEKNVRVSGTPSVVDLDGGGLAEVVIGARWPRMDIRHRKNDRYQRSAMAYQQRQLSSHKRVVQPAHAHQKSREMVAFALETLIGRGQVRCEGEGMSQSSR